MSSGVGCRRSSDPELLWLWHRPVATAPLKPLAWESPYATGAALKKTKNNNNKKNELLLLTENVVRREGNCQFILNTCVERLFTPEFPSGANC